MRNIALQVMVTVADTNTATDAHLRDWVASRLPSDTCTVTLASMPLRPAAPVMAWPASPDEEGLTGSQLRACGLLPADRRAYMSGPYACPDDDVAGYLEGEAADSAADYRRESA